MEISNAAADQLAEVIASYVNDNGDDRVQLIGEVLGEDSSGTTWVHILGGEQRTPVTSTNAKVHKGDIVYVVIGDGRADILGNVSRPSTDDTLAEVVQQRVVETERVVERIEATAITADSAEIQQLQADHAVIETLDSTYASIGSLNAATARIENIEADYLVAADMTAEQARVGQLMAGKADVADLTAANARIDSLESTKADISMLESDYITAEAIEANYLHADMSNADVAWIQNGVIKDGSISNAMINDVSANKLTAGTINGSVINVTNLNADNITAGTINGQRIGEGSLSLDKLSEDVYTEQEVDNKLSAMQAEIDGAIETWTGTDVPTLNNSPASGWNTSDERDRHVGDVYFVVNSNSQQNGYNYRFTKSGNTYSWQLIKDSDVTNALQRLSTAEGKITTFDSDISTLKTDTGTLKTKTESLETRMSDAEDDILDKVDTTTFNEVSDTVDQHSQSITQMSQTLSNKADGSTVTALTTRVSKTEQDITGINTTIGELSTTVESKADSSTVETVSNKLNTVSDTVDGHTQSITSINNTLETKADSSTVSTLTTKVNNVSDTVDGHTQTIGSVQTTQTQMQGKLDKTIVETTQLWYSKSSTDAPSKPTSQVTSTSTAGNAWRTVVPAYNASYPNYFYCYQWKYTDGTYGWSSVTRDIAMGESQERARTAISNAAAADTKAGNAATAAATAQSTAEGAKTTADTAKATADKNVKSTLQLWYTKANETAPAKPTSKVTSTSVSGNAWRVVVPTYSASYPYYFYCYQYELADGTYTWSDVVYDRATTENQSNSRSAVTGVSTLTTKTNTISDTVDGHTSQLSSITTTQTTIQGSAVKSTVQLWFTKANTTAPNKPTAHVTTNNASTANAWNLAVPTYNASYPYYYYCYEHQLLNDTYTWSAVTRDIATEESQSTSRSAASAAAAADTKAGNAATAAATADGKAVSAQNTANKNVRESQQLWYTKANSTAPAKPTSKVTSTATTGGAWTTRVPTYSDSYKHYFYCMQYVAADGTVTWSDVVYDQATTEAQSVARAASADLTEFHQEYATFKQTTQQFESTVGETYATKAALETTDGNVTNLTGRVSTAESSITQNARDISFRATKEEAAQMAQPNLSPYFSSSPYDRTSNSYWYGMGTNSNYTFTDMGDGWMRVQCTNSGSSVIRVDWYPIKCPSVVAGQPYTWLAEVRNNASTSASSGSDFYLVQTNNCQFWGQKAIERIEGPGGTSMSINIGTCGSSYVMQKVQNAETASDGHWTNNDEASVVGLACWTFRCAANSSIDYEVRLSLYEGRYAGPYKPYVGSQLYASQAELKVANDAISLRATKDEVEKTYSTKEDSQLDRAGSGTSVTVEGAANAALKGLHVLGESVQDGTPTPSAPKPIYSVGSPNMVSNSDVMLVSTYGSKTDSTSCVLTRTIPKGTMVTVSCHIEATNVTWAGSGSRRAGVEINQPTDGTSSGTQYVGVWWGISGSNHQGSDANFSGTLSAQVTLTRDFVANGSRVLGVYIQNITGGSITVSEPSLTVGHFKPYVPSDSIALLVKGRNMLGLATAGRYTNVAANGITWTMNDDGTVSANGTSTAISQAYWLFSEEEAYSFDGMELTGAPNVSGCSIRLEKQNSPYTAHAVDTGSGATVSFPSGADGACYLYCRVDRGKTVDVTFRPMIRIPSQPNDYEPYSGTVTPIPLNGHELRSLPDGTQDELTVDADGHVTMTRRVGCVESVGSKISATSTVYTVNGLKCVPYTPDNYSASSRPSALAAMITTGTVKSSSQVTTGDVYMNSANIMFMGDADDTAADIRTLYANATLTYPLVTPQTIDLGTIDMPQVKDGDTVEVIAALTPSIDMTWWASAGQAVADAYASLSSAIEVRAESIVSTVSERYATSQEVQAISSQIEQTAQGWTAQFNQLTGGADLSMTLAEAFNALGVTSRNLEEIRSFVRITTDDAGDPLLLMGSATSPIMLALSNDSLRFMHGSDPVAYIDVDGTTNEGKLHITRAVVVKELQFGSWKWFERDGVGNLALKWVGDE